LFRIVFATRIAERTTSIAADINTGAAPHHIFKWSPKKCIQSNYKMLFRSYKAWRGVDE
jgi:hypothetical protein